jgi:hypothetical protein
LYIAADVGTIRITESSDVLSDLVVAEYKRKTQAKEGSFHQQQDNEDRPPHEDALEEQLSTVSHFCCTFNLKKAFRNWKHLVNCLFYFYSLNFTGFKKEQNDEEANVHVDLQDVDEELANAT